MNDINIYDFTAIAQWLNKQDKIYDAYIVKNRIYYLDSNTDLKDLFNIFCKEYVNY